MSTKAQCLKWTLSKMSIICALTFTDTYRTADWDGLLVVSLFENELAKLEFLQFFSFVYFKNVGTHKVPTVQERCSFEHLNHVSWASTKLITHYWLWWVSNNSLVAQSWEMGCQLRGEGHGLGRRSGGRSYTELKWAFSVKVLAIKMFDMWRDSAVKRYSRCIKKEHVFLKMCIKKMHKWIGIVYTAHSELVWLLLRWEIIKYI